MDISAIIITRNEEENIKECIENLKFVSEIIVIDNCSKDNTPEVAKKMGAEVYSLKGLDFSYLRNYGKEKASGEWLLYLDADERITDTLSGEIKKRILNPDKVSAFRIPRKNYFLGKKWQRIEKMVRLIQKNALIGWQGSLHETPLITGNIGDLNSPLLHFTHRDINSMLQKRNEWSEIEANLRFQNQHPPVVWWRFFRVMMSAFWHSFVEESGWKVGIVGLIESLYQTFSIFITYAKLWEKQNRLKNNDEDFIPKK